MTGEENWHSENTNNPSLQQLEAFSCTMGKNEGRMFPDIHPFSTTYQNPRSNFVLMKFEVVVNTQNVMIF